MWTIDTAEDCMLATSTDEVIFHVTLIGWHAARGIKPYANDAEYKAELLTWMSLKVQRHAQRHSPWLTATDAARIERLVTRLCPNAPAEPAAQHPNQDPAFMDLLPTVVFLPSDDALTERINLIETSICTRQRATRTPLAWLNFARRFDMTAEAFEMMVFLLLFHDEPDFRRLVKLAHRRSATLDFIAFTQAVLSQDGADHDHNPNETPSPAHWLEAPIESASRLSANP